MTETIDAPTLPLTSGFLSWNQIFQEIDSGVSLGRDPTNQIVLADRCVSAEHARIDWRDHGFVIQDLKSRNGTFLNGTRILVALLRDGDRIRIGETDLRFTSAPETPVERLLVSKNARWQQELERLTQWAQSDLGVLINGPSGSGKEVMARAIHEFSGRRDHPLVCVNCSALSESLIESELFGHLRGSFTGAISDRLGAFAAAKRGTLFLDEIGDLPLALQPKLLRALENQEVRSVGSDRTLKTDVRLIAATHQDLPQLIRQGRFREDLYFRLNIIRLQVPALISHLEDFEDLLYHFAKQFQIGFSHAAIQALKQHRWPGNVRELRNLVARAKAYHGSCKIEPFHLPELLENLAIQVSDPTVSSRSVLKEIECEMIQERLVANQGNQRRTALDLRMPKSTLHDRIRLYGINIPKLLAQRGIFV